MKRAVLAVLLLLSACKPDDEAHRILREQMAAAKPVGMVGGEAVTVQRIGIVKDSLAYDSYRGIYIITDKRTGKEYIGVSGIGISEVGSHTEGKFTKKDER